MRQTQRPTGKRSGTMEQTAVAIDIFKLLKQEHAEIKSQFETIISGHKRNDEEFSNLKADLSGHNKAEEKTFYQPLMDKGDELKEMLLEGYVEHHMADMLAKEIGKEADEEKWLAKVRVLQETVMHHVKEEEGQVFKAAKPFVDRAMAQELGQKFEQARK